MKLHEPHNFRRASAIMNSAIVQSPYRAVMRLDNSDQIIGVIIVRLYRAYSVATQLTSTAVINRDASMNLWISFNISMRAEKV